jgi:hypothetical protein
MKSILKLSALAILLTVTSCAHHEKCYGDKEKSQCSMKGEKKECCDDKGQCSMKKDEAKTEEVKK